MGTVLALIVVALIVLVLWDSFEAMVLPRRVTRPFRPTRLFYWSAWTLWRAAARRFKPGRWRETFLSVFGPLSLLGLLAVWVVGLVGGFGLLHWSLGTPLQQAEPPPDLGTYLYLSGTTFFTLGYGDVTPTAGLGRALAVAEAGLGFAFLAVVIGYLPVLAQAFSRREVTISLLDARAGSPPSATELLSRAARAGGLAAMNPLLAEWERWSAEVLEGHLSFPVLSYYRSQHDNQSWLAALTAVLDTCALQLAVVKGADRYQAQLTFAMARHAVVDLALVFRTPPVPPTPDRLDGVAYPRLLEKLKEAGVEVRQGPEAEARLVQLRGMYEPFVQALAGHLLLALPPLLVEKPGVDNWQTSAWMRRVPGIGSLPAGDDHFD